MSLFWLSRELKYDVERISKRKLSLFHCKHSWFKFNKKMYALIKKEKDNRMMIWLTICLTIKKYIIQILIK